MQDFTCDHAQIVQVTGHMDPLVGITVDDAPNVVLQRNLNQDSDKATCYIIMKFSGLPGHVRVSCWNMYGFKGSFAWLVGPVSQCYHLVALTLRTCWKKWSGMALLTTHRRSELGRHQHGYFSNSSVTASESDMVYRNEL